MGFRFRLTLYGALIAGIAMVVFGVALGGLATAAAPDDQAKQLRRLAEESAASLADAPVESFQLARPPIAVDPAGSTETFVVVYDGRRPVYATGWTGDVPVAIPDFVLTEAEQTGSAARTVTVEGVELRVHAVPWVRTDLALDGIAVAAQPTAFVDEQLQGLRAFLWVAGIITMLAAALVAWFVSGRALRPLRQLATTVDAVASTGDLSSRLPSPRRRDEVGRLTAGFNEMLERLQSSQQDLEAAIEEQRRFVADASHELRTPLTSIRTNAGFLLRRPEATPDDRAAALNELAAEADRMAMLVGGLLELARSDAGLTLRSDPVDLESIVREVVRGAGDIDAQGGSLIVPGDRDALYRVIAILVDNARKHGAPPIRVRWYREDGNAVVSVSDHGPGIPPDQRSSVFGRFYRADPARSPAGAGLGLAIAAEVVTSHGGTIAVDDVDGGGARFTLLLPAA